MGFLLPSFKDIIDIILIAFVIYQAMLIIRKSGGYQVLYGLIVLVILYFLSTVFKLRMSSFLLSAFRNYWILAIVILFQPEIRAMLAQLNISSELSVAFRRKEKSAFYGALIDSISSMSFSKTGALIVIENKRKLSEYIQAGEPLDSLITLRLILTIFNTRSILHDGAIIIREDRIKAAKVVLPLSKKSEFVHIYGTRHLAGIGITEVSDAVAIIVSEQTGKISVASGGTIQSNIAFEELMQIITDATK